MAIGSITESVLIVAFFLIPFSHLWGQLPPQPSQGEGGSANDWATALSVALIFGLPSLLPFGLLARLPVREPAVRRTAVVVAVILLPALVSLATYPCCTSDVLDYVNRQRLWVVYAENPFTLVPNDHPEDWSYYFANFKSLAFGYGPAWWLLARVFTQWATTLDQYLLGFKLLAMLCFGVSAALVWRLADERTRLVSLAFFAWNPAVLIEGLVRLHNDLLTVPLVLGAVWLYRAGRSGPALLVSAVAALVKVTVAPLGLVIAASLAMAGRWRSLALAGVATGALLLALYTPFWVGLSTLAPLFAQAGRPQWSLGAILLYVTGLSSGSAPATVIRVVLAAVCVALTGVLLARLRTDAGSLVDTAVLVMLVGLLCLPLAFYSHYLMPAVGLAAVAADARVRGLVLAIGFGAMINAVLGVDTFAGGPTDTLLDVTGSCVLIVAVAVGLRFAARATPRPVPAS